MVVAADTSYSDQDDHEDRRGAAVSEVLITGNKTVIHGETATGKQVEWTQEEDRFVGRPTTDGRWVRAKMKSKDEYLLGEPLSGLPNVIGYSVANSATLSKVMISNSS